MAEDTGSLGLREDGTSLLLSFWRSLRRWPVVALVILATLVTLAVFAPVIAPHHPIRGHLSTRNKPPLFFEGSTTGHIFGTDHQGRDLFTRFIYGARVSLAFAAATVAVSVTIGAPLGAISGYFGGHVDEVIMRVVDLVNALPFVLVALVAVMVFGPSFLTLLVILALFSWGALARQVRGEALQLRTTDYVALARVAGASPLRIIWRHLLPGVTNTLIVVATLRAGQIILSEATLSFLGVGIPPPNPAWGSMVSSGRDYLSSAWWIAVIPGLGIGITVFALNFLGDWLRDRFDPRLRQV